VASPVLVRVAGIVTCILSFGLGIIPLTGAVVGGTTASLVGVGYYVDYDANSRVTVQTQGQQINWIITTNYDIVNTQGTIQGTHDATIMADARSRGVGVHFRLANRGFNRDIVHRVLTRSSTRQRVENGILNILNTYGYDGVNIDFENVAPGDRAALTSFMGRLAARLGPLGKTLSMAVPPKTADIPNDDWNGAFDYRALGGAVNWLIVMAYDEHWSGSAPGPVASMPWVETVVWFAINSNVPPQKILLGVALYGYDWPTGGSGEGISMHTALARATQHGATISYDPVARVPYYRYSGHTVYFEDSKSVEHKVYLAMVLQLAGIAAWRLGHEVPETWSAIGPYLARGGTTAARNSSQGR
jgi:spore germination protein YaaH